MISTIILSILFALASIAFLVSGDKASGFSCMAISVLLKILSDIEVIEKILKKDRHD